MNRARRQAIFERLRAANPSPTTELEYRTPFELLIAVILSAQATDVSVNKATRGLFRDAPTPEAMLRLGEAGGWSRSTAARCPAPARPSSRCPGWGARRRT